MAKFTKAAPRKTSHPTFNSDEIHNTVNKEGEKAFTLPCKERLATRVMTSLINEEKFYGDNTAELLEDVVECGNKEPLF